MDASQAEARPPKRIIDRTNQKGTAVFNALEGKGSGEWEGDGAALLLMECDMDDMVVRVVVVLVIEADAAGLV